MLFHQIPLELQERPQWVCWKLVPKDKGGFTKLPVNARSGDVASVTDPATWCDFATAVAAVNIEQASKLPDYAAVKSNVSCGIGYVFAESDPYAGIDIDDANGNTTLLAAHRKIIEAFPSYSELSPSRRGLHIIVQGTIKGARKFGVEAYSKERYFAFTGDVWRNLPIINCQPMLEELQHDLQPSREHHAMLNTVPQTEDDIAIIAKMTGAANSAKAQALAHGDASVLGSSDNSPSAIDQALCNIIQFYTKNAEQIERIWLSTPHGQNPQRLKKLRRIEYRTSTIRRAFDKEVAAVDFTALQQQWQASAAVYVPPPVVLPAQPVPPVPTVELPPGLLGEVARFIYDSAARQVPEIALVGAIGWFSGVCGKAYNVNGSGLNTYLALLASSGSGKEAISSGYAMIEDAIISRGVPAVKEFIGPANFASPQAVLKHVTRAGSSVSLVGEFGGWLGQMVGTHVNPVRSGIKDVLLELYGKSGKRGVYRQTVYSDKENNIMEIRSPSLSILGETTPSTFYRNITEQVIEDGFLPRFIIMEYEGLNLYINEASEYAQIPNHLAEQLAQLATQCLEINQSMHMVNGGPVPVDIDLKAKQLMSNFSRYCTDQSNVTGIPEGVKNVWSRVWLNAMKLAALVAVGCDSMRPVISEQHATWAIRLVSNSVTKLTGKVESGAVAGSLEAQQWSELVRVIKLLPTQDHAKLFSYGITEVMWKYNVINHTFLHRRVGMLAPFKSDRLGPANALKRVVQRATDEGVFVPLAKYDPWVVEHKIAGVAYAVNVAALR